MPEKSEPNYRRPRDVRLDFFRGIGMFIIFFSHMPGNPWAKWIPARFGFSDATEIFVFCSGMASALAFGSIYTNKGFWLGTARVAFRSWQVYWAHIGAFFVITATMIAINIWLDVGDKYVAQLNLLPFLERNTSENLLGLLTLTYVPNYFDILPMYLVILTMIPMVMLLAKLSRWAAIFFVIAVYIVATLGYLQLPAEPWSERRWFFHPFAWQLVFFTGFAFVIGWLPAPPINRGLVALALAIVIISFPIKYWPIYNWLDPDFAYRSTIMAGMDKTKFRLLRYIHFLSLAYLAYAWAGEHGRRLAQGWITDVCRKVGQQALAVFLVGLLISRIGGVLLDYHGKDVFTVAAINLSGMAILIATAYVVGWFKSAPWNKPATTPGKSAPIAQPASTKPAAAK